MTVEFLNLTVSVLGEVRPPGTVQHRQGPRDNPRCNQHGGRPHNTGKEGERAGAEGR